MIETEHARVGHTLYLLRDVLAPYVDAAMTKKFGPGWEEQISRENAERRKDGRIFPVKKSDLAVLLAQLVHKRMAPWADDQAKYPRIRSFASEVLNLRNQHAHGDECENEHIRLIDTATRLLQLLDLPIPDELRYSPQPETAQETAQSNSTSLELDPFSYEIGQLGESGKPVASAFETAEKLRRRLYRIGIELQALQEPQDIEIEPGLSFSEYLQIELVRTEADARTLDLGVDPLSSLAAEVIGFFDGLAEIELSATDSDPALIALLAQCARCLLLKGPLGLALLKNVETYVVSSRLNAIEELLPSAEESESQSEERATRLEERIEALDRKYRNVQGLSDETEFERWLKLYQLASRLGEANAVAATMIVVANMGMADTAANDEESLRLIREALHALRFLAAGDPGSKYESWLVLGLRREGKLCNDLGRTDEAIQAFARADEIIDRYPAADPDLAG